ncbi:ClpB protein [Salmonella enterica subsp. enterica]|nr:ClpB protein [Salmonella enterica subsp. enterica] [Salmonella enterica subsp. enterica serovar Menston]
METPVSRSALYGKLAGPLFRSLESATAFCKLRSNPWVELTHWLHQLTQQPITIFSTFFGITRSLFLMWRKRYSGNWICCPPGPAPLVIFLTISISALKRPGMLASVRYGDNKIRSGWLLLALLTTPELRRVLSSICAPLATLPVDELTEILPSLIETSPEAQERPYDGSGLASAIPGESSQAIPNSGAGR